MAKEDISSRRRHVGPKKAKEILRHGSVKGNPLSDRQEGYFGMLAGGSRPTRMKGRKGGGKKRGSY